MTPAPVNSSTTIHILWEQFVQSTSSSYEKTRWMDLFLSEFLTQLKEKKSISEILNCCTPGLAGTLLSCELLSDVHNLCQQPGQQEDDTLPLRNFLLSGRGARCLLALHALGTQGISCGRELAGLLISLYPICLQSTDTDELTTESCDFYTPDVDLDVENIFKVNTNFKTKMWSMGSLHPRPSNASITSSSRYQRKRSSAGSAPQGSASSESDEDLAEIEGDLSPLAPTLRIQLNPMDFDYFTSVIRSEDEIEKKVEEPLNPDDFMQDTLNPAMNIKFSVVSLCQLLVSLIKKLCVSEPVDSTCQTSIQAINFTLENLCALQFGSTVLGSSDQVADLKYSLVLLLLTALDRSLQQSDSVSLVMHSGMFPLLLRVIEDAVRKSMQLQDDINENEITLRKEFIYATMYGALTLLQSLLQKHEKFKDFMELFRLFSDSQGGHLIENSISVLLKTPCNHTPVVKAKKLVTQIGYILASLKKVRAEVVHTRLCKKHRHKQCGIPFKERFHHLDIISHTQGGSLGTSCNVAKLFVVLIRIAEGCTNVEVASRAVRVMTQSGACCCIPPQSLLLPILELARRLEFGNRAYTFTLLEKVLFTELGGSGETAASPSSCPVCGTQVLSLLFSSDSATEDTSGSSIVQGNSWDCLEQYKSLLESQDYQLCITIIDHIFKIIPFTSNAVKHSLLFKVFYPTFLDQKVKFFDAEGGEISKFLMLCSLSVLSSQLCTVTFAEEFISKRGLDHILELILMPEFSKLCCSILEVTIVIELWRSNREEAEVSTASLTMLLKALEASAVALTSSLQKVATKYRRKREEPIHITESDSGCLTEPTDSSDSGDLPSKNTLLEQLNSAVVFWRACASLVACSPQFRTHLATHELAAQALKLLQLVTRQAVRGPSFGEEDYARGTEAFLTLRLLEALLTICLGIETSSLSQSESSVQECGEVVREVRQAVMTLKPCGRSHVQALSEVLLRCAATHYFEHQVLPARSKPELPVPPASLSIVVSHLDIEEGEGSSSFDDSYLTADEGYEADVELLEGLPKVENTIESLLVGEDAAMSPLLAHQAQCRGGFSAVSKPELCCLVVALLVQLHEEHGAEPNNLSSSLAHALQRLAALCRDSPHNCVILAKHGVIATLLSGFADCLKMKDTQQADLQRVILDLVSLLARYSITRQELALYLNFFKAENPPCEALLWPLVTLASHSKPQPNFILCFPAKSTNSTLDTAPQGLGEAEALAWNLHKKHKDAGLLSAWACSALVLPLSTSMGWSPWTTGLSLALWLRIEGDKENVLTSRISSPRHSTVSCSSESSTSVWNMFTGSNGSPRGSFTDSMKSAQQCNERLLHVFSLGGEALTLEAWADAATELLVLRLNRHNDRPTATSGPSCSELLAEAVTEAGFLTRANWHLLTINIKDYMEHRQTVIEVTIIIDGWRETILKLSFNGLLIRKTRPTCLLVGHSSSSKKCTIGSWYLGSLMLFRTHVFTRERAMRLAALGPGTTGLTECDGALPHHPNLVGLLSPRTISCGVKWNDVLDETLSGGLKVLQDNLLLLYSAQNCSMVQIYPLVVTSPGGGMSSLFPPGQAGFRVVTAEQRASQQVPLSVPPLSLLGEGKILEAQCFRGFAAAASLLGGVQVFLVLFARVVELQASEGEQAAALSLLLRLAHADAELFSQLAECHKLLLRVLESPRCRAGPIMLKALLDACCDRSVILQTGGELTVSNAVEAIVTNSFLLNTAVRAWRAWDSAALSSLFRALHALLRDDHPYREFNASQLNRARLTETLLLFCKEKFLYEDKEEEKGPQLQAAVSCSLVELIRSLMGAPPEFSHVVFIADFLLLLHRASATYVTHSRNNFYFLLVPEDPLKSMHLTESECKRPKTQLAQPVDPLKLNKALTNLHIKRNAGDNELEAAAGDLESLDSNRIEEEQASSVEQHEGISLGYSNDSGLSLFPTLGEHKEQQWEKFVSEAELQNGQWQQGEKANAQSLVVEGLLLLLRDTILVLPDSMSHQVLTHVVRAEILLTMANHPDSRVRTAVIKVVAAYLQRATEEESNKFLKMKGFHLLANQLSQYEATVELIESCVALVTHCQVSLEEQTELWSLRDLGPLQIASFPPLLALLPRCVADTALCHNTVYFLREVITKAPQSFRPLLDNGLLETLGRTLLEVLHLPPEPSDICGLSEQDLTIGDIFVFYVTIAVHAVCLSGSHNMQVVLEILLQLGFLERRERHRCGWPSRCVQALRDAQCSVLEGVLDRIQGRRMSTDSHSKSSTIFVSMMSSSSDEAMSSISAQHLMAVHMREVPRTEVTERYKLMLQKSAEFLLSLEVIDGQYRETEVESAFSRVLFLLLIRSLTATFEKQPRPSARTPWQTAIWAARDTIRMIAGQLMCWLLSPRHSSRLRLFVIHTLNSDPRCRELLSSMLQSNSQLEYRFSMFFRDIMCDPTSKATLTVADSRACNALFGSLQSWGMLQHSMQSIPQDPGCWPEELSLLHETIDRQRMTASAQAEAAQLRSVQCHEHLAKVVAETAMQATRAAVEAQNGERKAFIEHIKAVHSVTVQLRARWHLIVRQFTHERAPWFFSESYPRSWQLDPTEGPGRVRNRLKRCHLGIKEKYLMPEYQQKLESQELAAPLSYLFAEDGVRCSNSSVLIERLYTNEKVRHMVAAQVVTPEVEVSGELLVGETCLYFVPEELDATSVVPSSTLEQQHGSVAWQFEEIREIHSRRYQLQERAIEVFLTNGKTYFLALPSQESRNAFIQVVTNQCHLPNLQPSDTQGDILQLWREGLISNFEYLSQLNKMAGRSFNDLMQYPIFPFVLSDYTSARLDLANPKIYRDFKRPMAVQDKKNEQHYINTYNYLKQELQTGMNSVCIHQEPFHYGSHYSNSGTVLHFLVRMPPFTRMFLHYQDNNFDIPDRTFHSLHTTWRLTSSDSTTDVKELIPEFFFLPEFLLNSEGFSLGVRQSGERVHHVMLPPWCTGDPRLFILVHRQALESDFVRENLPHWIDLVFGYKQTGKPAVDAINVFHPATYYGFDIQTIKDPLERNAWETMVRTYGQTPCQLFKVPHPMVIQALASKDTKKISSVALPLGGAVQNLHWGSYVGSPAETEPRITWKHSHRSPVAGLVPLRNNDVFGLAPCTSLLLVYNGRGSLLGSPSIQGAALISWGHADGVVRAKIRKDQPLRPLVQCPGLDPVLLCASTLDVPQLWLALASGRLLVLRFPLHATRGVLEPCEAPYQLLGHEDQVLSLYLCRAFSIAVSGSQDGTAIIWDINTLSYVRTIPSVGVPVQLVTVSDVSGDIATTCPASTTSKSGSCLRLYTVNASLVGKVICEEQITSVCFSCAPEGCSINVVAAGLSTGDVNLVYSHDAQHLYASAADGTLVIWETSGARGKTAKFLNLTSL